MAKIVFRLAGVPDQEAAEARELLDQHEVDWYETSAGRWGISMPALWVRFDDDYEKVRFLIDEWQCTRNREFEPEPISFWRRCQQHPIEVLVTLLAAVGVLAISLLPFMTLFH